MAQPRSLMKGGIVVIFILFQAFSAFSFSRTNSGGFSVSILEVEELTFASHPEQPLTSPSQFSVLGSLLRPSSSCEAIYEENPFFPDGFYYLSIDGEVQKKYCVPPYGTSTVPSLSCLHLKNLVQSSSSGRYFIKDGSSDGYFEVYCDMETDGGGWALLSKFDQNEGTTSGISSEYYETYLENGGWIRGLLPDTPLSPSNEAGADDMFFASHDWAKFLQKGRKYQIRQRALNEAQNMEFDFCFTFTYPGFLLQDDAPTPPERAWVLSNRTVLSDTTGQAWITSGSMYFWPPFTPSATDTGPVYSGCGSFEYSERGCGQEEERSRRNGCAGIITPNTSSEAALPFMPHFYAGRPLDILFCHVIPDVFGNSHQKLQGTYWLREVLDP
eukprot:GCRY01001429.1.p1 GENE.GCRY01001429.1~~GCRY01001429.1.p1  ORF type:complete len:385 (+),score=42.32 GCRY01001429.1:123-1277(+)